MKSPYLFVAIVGIVMSMSVLSAAGTRVAVTACGQRVLDDGYLVGDLDCTADEVSAYPAVTMAGNGNLDLRGFTITGGANAVQCEVRCQVFGGSIAYGNLAGVSSLGRAIITDVSIANRSPAVSASKIIAERSTFSYNWSSLWAASGSVVMIDSAITEGAEYGVRADRRATLRNSSVTGNALSGVFTNKAVVRDSTVTGNGTDPECNVTRDCADLHTFTKPRMRRSICGTSVVAHGLIAPPYTDWDVCTFD